MRVGIDARLLGGRYTGDRTYWRGLLGGLAALPDRHEYLLYVRESLADELGGLAAEFGRSASALEERVVGGCGGERAWSLLALPRAARRDRVDVVHVQYAVSPLFFLLGMPVVTTVHDISFRLFPELFRPMDRLLLNGSVPYAVRRACGVIAVSESTRSDVVRAYRPMPAGKVAATPLAAGPEYRPLRGAELEQARGVLREQHGIGGADEPYALAVGVLQPRKNLPMLLRAFGAARRLHGFPHRLVVVGKRGWLSGEIDAALIAAEAAGDAVTTGYVPDEHLPLLYNCADLTCYPSLYEGFGLPPLEAMACGCPVMASSVSSLPEVVGGAGLLLDPHRPGEWIDAVGRVLSDPELRRSMNRAGIRQAAEFSWAETARKTLAVYTTCHNSAGSRS